MAATIGTAFIEVKPDLAGFGTSLRTGVSAATSRAEQNVRTTGGRLGGLFGSAFGLAAKLGLAGLGIHTFLEIGRGVMSVVKAGATLNETLNKSNVVFGRNARAIRRWADDAVDRMALTTQEAIASASGFGDMFQGMGLALDQSTLMSQKLVELAGDLHSFNNVPTTEALEALQSGLIGQSEPLRRFNVFLDEARLKAEALRLGLIREGDQLTQGARAQAAYSLIMQDTTRAQGDLGRTSDSAANQMEQLNKKYEDAKDKLGFVLLPAFTGAITFLNEEIIPGFEGFVSDVGDVWDDLDKELDLGDTLDGIREDVKKFWDDLQKDLEGAGESLKQTLTDGVETMKLTWQNFGDELGGIAGGFIGRIIDGFTQLFQIVRGVMLVFEGLMTQDWSMFWHGMQLIVDGVWDNIYTVISGTVMGIYSVLRIALTLIWNLFIMILQSIDDAVRKIREIIIGLFAQAWDIARERATNSINQIADAVRALPGEIMAQVGKMWDAGWRLGSNLLQGINDALTDPGFVGDLARGLGNLVIDAWNRFADRVNDLIPNSIFGFDIEADPLDHLARFDEGGLVPGRRGAPMLAIVHGGEYVSPVGAPVAGAAAVAIQEANFVTPADFDALLNRVNLALAAGRL